MVSIKIECPCGQHYRFDAEPVQGQMPYTVACPTCGADGTAAANEVIAQNTPRSEPVVAVKAAPAVRLVNASPAIHLAPARHNGQMAAPQTQKLMPGQVERPQAEAEARAKILWGDAPDEVVKFLMRQNIPYEEAAQYVDELLDERAAAVRGNGIRKIATGSGLIAIPVVTWFIFMNMGVFSIKLFAIAVTFGLWGAWRAFNGSIMLASPRTQKGDVSDQ